MSRRNVRSALAVLVVAGGLALAPSNAEGADRSTQEPGFWSLALQWVAQGWEENVLRVWETQGWQVDPNGGNSSGPPTEPSSDQGWQVDPNG